MKHECIVIGICLLLISSTTVIAIIPLNNNDQKLKNQFVGKILAPWSISKRWMKTFGGADNDIGYSVQQTFDDGYIITGSTYTFSNGMDDVWLIKTNRNGAMVWDKTFGGKNTDYGVAVQQTIDGGYIITGLTQSFSTGLGSVWLIKTNDKGDMIWDKIFGGTKYDGGNYVQQTSDGGYIITGFTTSFGVGDADVWLIKTDANGNKMWEANIGGDDVDYAGCVQQTNDGGYIITGLTQSFGAGDADVWLIKTDANGTSIWDKTFGGIDIDYGGFVQQTSDGGYIIIGLTQSFGSGLGDVWLIKTDYNGDKMWDKLFGGINADCGYAVQQLSNEGYIITASTMSFGAGLSDVWVIKTNRNGDMIWDKTFGGMRNDEGYSIQETRDGGYIITGLTQSSDTNVNYDILLIKTDTQGKAKTTSFVNLWFECLFQRFPRLFPICQYDLH